jgi:gamma-butyrobetaine dioxygenase
MPNGVAITLTEHAADSVALTFAPDQHRSEFSRSWLAAHAPGGASDDDSDGDERAEDAKELWLAADLDPGAGRFPQASWPRYLDEPAERIRALEAVLRLGFVLLRAVPAEPGTVLEVAASFGFVRETNYGRLFDVRVEAQGPAPGNLAFTSQAIRPHTDNPYRDPVPTVQLLHCLRAAGQGGDTGLVDGFAAAGANHRSMGPLRGPRAGITAFYAAYRRWAELLAEPGRQLNLRLAPGDCLVFDNTRVLHARTAFSLSAGSPGRHLQGCYADLDGLASTLAVNSRSGNHGREEE